MTVAGRTATPMTARRPSAPPRGRGARRRVARVPRRRSSSSRYGLANWSAAQRADVPSLVFEWERAIPFWAWTIVPYWSIDVLYGLSLFVCATRRELDTHAKRLLTAQLVAVACFVALPLRFSFERPAADGVFGAAVRRAGGLRPAVQPDAVAAHRAGGDPVGRSTRASCAGLARHAMDALVLPDRRVGADHVPAPLHRHSRPVCCSAGSASGVAVCGRRHGRIAVRALAAGRATRSVGGWPACMRLARRSPPRSP